MIVEAGIFEFLRTEMGGAEGGGVDGFDDAGGVRMMKRQHPDEGSFWIRRQVSS